MEYSGEKYQVIVIGGGIMGSCTAYQSAKRGEKTLLVEQFDFLHQRGSSHGESRTIRTTYPEDYYSTMVLQSAHLWEEAEAEIGYKVYFKTPHLDMGPSNNTSLQAVISSCQKNSISNQILHSHHLINKFSGKIKIPQNWIGLSTQIGGVIKPTKALSMFQTLAHKHGAALRDNTQVVDIKKKGDLILVSTSNGDNFWAEKCVVTVGAWMKKLVERVTCGRIVLPIQPLETNVCYWKIKQGHEEEFSIGGGFPTFASYGEPYIYGTPSLEYPGLIKIAVHAGHQCDPDKRTWAPVPMILDSLKQWIKERFGDLVQSSTGPVMMQSCLYSMTPDEDFVIDFLGGEFGEDLVVAGGFSGHGFKMAPVVGRLLVDLLLTGEAKGVEINHFQLSRFDRNLSGNAKEFEDQVTAITVNIN